MKQRISLEIFKGLGLFLLLTIGLYLAFEVRGVVISLFLAFILNAGLRPLINFLESKGFNRTLAIAITYLAGFALTIGLVFLVVNATVDQVKTFVTNIDSKVVSAERFVNNYVPFLNSYIDFDSIRGSVKGDGIDVSAISSSGVFSGLLENVSVIGGQGISIAAKIFGGLLSLFAIIMISIYMLSNRKSAYEDLIELLPKKRQKRILDVFKKIESSLGSWLVGQFSLMLMIGFLTFLIVSIPSLFDSTYPLLSYAFIIAVIAGILEGVPNLGPIITLVFAVFIALISGSSLGILIYIVISFFALQQIEGIFLVPAVMKRAVDLNPILSIAGVLAGFQLGGPLAALISVPVIAVVQIVIQELSAEWKKLED